MRAYTTQAGDVLDLDEIQAITVVATGLNCHFKYYFTVLLRYNNSLLLGAADGAQALRLRDDLVFNWTGKI